MSLEMGTLPGTIRTASVVLHIDGLAPGVSGLATVSLTGVKFNEVDAPAVFSLLFLHVARAQDLRIELCAMADDIEEWPRWTARREFTVQVWNLEESAISARDVRLYLHGFPVSVVPKAEKWTRKAALPVNNAGTVVTAFDALGAPLVCAWRPLSFLLPPG